MQTILKTMYIDMERNILKFFEVENIVVVWYAYRLNYI